MPQQSSAPQFQIVGRGAYVRKVRYQMKPGDQILIGRARDADICIAALEDFPEREPLFVSREHAFILDVPGKGWCIRDNSKHGTWILHHGLPPAIRLNTFDTPLIHGDVIELGPDGLCNLEWCSLAVDADRFSENS